MIYRRFPGWFAVAVPISLVLIAVIGSVGGQDTKTPSQGESRPRQAGEPPQQSTPTLRRSDRNEESNEQTDDVVRIETDLANLFFTAVDKNRRFITTIRKEDIRLLEDGLPQEIFTFQRETDRALSLAILVDVSASQQLTLQDEKDAARRFVNAVVHQAKDEVLGCRCVTVGEL